MLKLLAESLEHTPAGQEGPYVLGASLVRAAVLYPERPAVVHLLLKQRLTWTELASQAASAARGLLAIGVKKGDRVGLWGLAQPGWVILYFAAELVGAVVVPINSNCQPVELAAILRRAHCVGLLIAGDNREVEAAAFIKEVLGDYHAATAGGSGLIHSTALPELRFLVMHGLTTSGIYDMTELEHLGEAVPLTYFRNRVHDVQPGDVAMLQFTSGTTGSPKGVLLTHRSLAINAWWAGKTQRLTSVDSVCMPVPLFHCFGCVLGLLSCTAFSAALVLVDTFSPARVFATIEEECCTAFYGVPSMFRLLLRSRALRHAKLSTLRTGIIAGAVCPEELLKQAMDILHMPEITICYGQTESSPVITQTDPKDRLEKRVASIGRPHPGVEVGIFSPTTGERLPKGENGEICCRGNNVMAGYDEDPEATAATIDRNGWLHTGDLGLEDDDGYFHVSGRIRDIIIRCGENISPKEVENCLARCPGVGDAQVVGVASETCGEEVCAFLIADGSVLLSQEAVRRFCREQLSSYKVPRHLALLASFPMTASGKVNLGLLRRLAAAFFPPSGPVQAGPVPECNGQLAALLSRG